MDKLIGNSFSLNQVKSFPVNKAKVEDAKVSKVKNEIKSKAKVKKFAVISIKSTFEIKTARSFIFGIKTGFNLKVFFYIFSKFNFILFILF